MLLFGRRGGSIGSGQAPCIPILAQRSYRTRYFYYGVPMHAEQKGLADQVRQIAHIDLHYIGKDMVEALTQGYEFVTF